MLIKGGNKSAQATIFIIIAVVVVAAVAVFFIGRGVFSNRNIPANFEPVYETFLSCVEDYTLTGVDVLESSGGYIELPEFEPGSSYMPFSNQLNFLGNPIPYWYYVSGNNIQKEQVPLRADMEEQLAGFIEDKISNCRFDSYYANGYSLQMGEPSADVSISENSVEVSLDMNLQGEFADESFSLSSHKISVKSSLGELYNAAKKIYSHEQETLFLEEYGVDVMRLYAPVDGVELTCSPEMWNADEVFENLSNAIESNTHALRVKGGAYSLREEENKYFVVDVSVNNDVRFLTSRNWPNSFEVMPAEGNLLIAKPIGDQPGLGILGFCYVPYHFVYNLRYPVLVQIYNGDEIFQFPMAVVIQSNNPREAAVTNQMVIEDYGICDYENTPMQVNAYTYAMQPIEADISYECFGARCDIGRTSVATGLRGEFPQCVNGFVVAKADGFVDAREIKSTTESGSVDIFLKKLYSVNVSLKLGGRDYDGKAVITFMSEDNIATVVYPETREVELAEGQYTITAYAYRNSSLRIDSSSFDKCVDVPKEGVSGLLGLTEERCFNIDIPSQIISDALAGGGIQEYYILEDELIGAEEIEINADTLPLPTSLEQLQQNYALFEQNRMDIYII